MSIPIKHIVHQGQTLVTLGNVAAYGLKQQLGLIKPQGVPPLPGPEFVMTVPPRPPDLVKDFVRSVGGSPSSYKKTLPPYMFPQWIFTVAEKTQRGLPYPLFKMINGGCRVEINGPLPADRPLRVAARLESIDDNERRAILHQRVETGTITDPELVVSHIYVVVPLSGGKKEGGKKKAKNLVPADAREIAYWKIPANAGLSFAALTGDFNPVHWFPAYARAFGFQHTILHGFATFARAIEGLNRVLFSGDTTKLTTFDARFTKPLVLPAQVGLYLKNGNIFVGEAPGGPTYLTATYQTHHQGDKGQEESES